MRDKLLFAFYHDHANELRLFYEDGYWAIDDELGVEWNQFRDARHLDKTIASHLSSLGWSTLET